MKVFYSLLATCTILISLSETLKATMDYQDDTGRHIKHPLTLKGEFEKLNMVQKETIHRVSFGRIVADEDTVEISNTLSRGLPNFKQMYLSEASVTVNGMINLIPVIRLQSLEEIYPSPNFVQADLPKFTEALTANGISPANHETYLRKIIFNR